MQGQVKVMTKPPVKAAPVWTNKLREAVKLDRALRAAEGFGRSTATIERNWLEYAA
jgi:hypothetical protein